MSVLFLLVKLIGSEVGSKLGNLTCFLSLIVGFLGCFGLMLMSIFSRSWKGFWTRRLCRGLFVTCGNFIYCSTFDSARFLFACLRFLSVVIVSGSFRLFILSCLPALVPQT